MIFKMMHVFMRWWSGTGQLVGTNVKLVDWYVAETVTGGVRVILVTGPVCQTHSAGTSLWVVMLVGFTSTCQQASFKEYFEV